MKCQYRFKIEGKLTLSENKPLSIRGHVYEFETGEGGLVTHIKVTKTLENREEWPQFGRSTEPGIGHDARLNATTLPGVQFEMRSLEAALPCSA